MADTKKHKKQAKNLKSQGMSEYNIEDLKKQLDIPKNGIFLGYVVHLPNTDEFLASYIENDLGILKTIVKKPDLAMIFDDIEYAIKVSQAFNYKALVCLLFDIGTQYLVITHEEIGNRIA